MKWAQARCATRFNSSKATPVHDYSNEGIVHERKAGALPMGRIEQAEMGNQYYVLLSWNIDELRFVRL